MQERALADDRLMTPQEAADYLNVPVVTLQTWRARRNGPRSYRVGRHTRYRRQDIDDWLLEREQQAVLAARRTAP